MAGDENVRAEFGDECAPCLDIGAFLDSRGLYVAHVMVQLRFSRLVL